jgi:tape measure domain-containing protein
MRANRYVSYLAAEIEPAALANARTFEREIEKTLDRISQKSASGSSAFASSALGTGVSRNLNSISSAAGRTKRDLDVLDSSQVKAARSATLMGASFSRAADALQIVQGPLGPMAGRLSALGQVLRQLTGFTLAGVLAGGGAFALGGIATQYQKMHDTLVPVIGDQKALKVAMNDVIGIAGRTHQALQPVAELYSQFSRVGKDAGLSQQRIARLTETVSKASKIGGGDPEAQRGAIIQFGQALTANFHGSGQELQSILEQTPALAQAIADGLGTQTSKLKQLAKDGQLSTDLVVKALERSADEIDARFARMPPRVGKALQDVSNSLSVFVGKMDESVGATTAVANGLEFLATHLRGIVVLAGTVGAAYSAKLFVGAIEGATQYASKLAAIAPLTNEQVRFNEIVKRSLQERAAAEVQTAETAIAAEREYQVQLQSQIGLIEKQIVAQTRALEMARTLDAGMRVSGGTGSGQVLAQSYEELNASERALLATQAELQASDAALMAAEERLAAATTGLAVADTELAAAETAAIGATGRLAGAKAVLQGAMTRVGSAAKGLIGFLGGAWGVAFTAAAGWAMYLASRTDYAKEAIDNFAGGQSGLLKRLDETSAGMGRQADQAYKLARALREAGLAKAEESVRDVAGQTAGDIHALRNRLPIGSADFATADKLLAQMQGGAHLTPHGMDVLQGIIQRHPDAAQGSFLAGLTGDNAGRLKEDMGGLVAALDNVAQARQAITDADKKHGQAMEGLLGGGGGKPTTKAALNAQAKLLAAQDPLSKARAELQVAMQAGPKADETSDEYKQRIAGLIQNVNSLVDARKAERAATAAQRREQAAYNKELRAEEKGRDNADKLAGIMDQYTEDSPIKRLDKLRDAAEKAKLAVDDLVGERVGPNHIFTAQEAAAKKDQIDAFEQAQERKPVTDFLKQSDQELAVQTLISKGLGDQAEFIRRKYELEKQVGKLLPEEEQQIRDQIAQENKLNDAIYKRQALIENNARALDAIRDTLQESISAALQGDVKGGIKNFKNIFKAIADAKASEITMKLIGDPGKKYRDDMYRGLNDSASKLSTSGDQLQKAASDLTQAAGALAGGGTGVPGVGGKDFGTPSTSSLVNKLLSPEFAKLSGVLGDLTEVIRADPRKSPIDPNSIVVTGKRLAGGSGLAGGGIGETIQTIADQIFGKGSKASGIFGAGIKGAETGAIVSGVANLFGLKLSQGGSMVGGAIGGIAGSLIPGVGTVIGSLVGSILGGIVGGLFSHPDFARANIKGVNGVITSTPGNDDHGAEQKAAAKSMSDAFTQGLQKISQQLGLQLGNFAVSIGVNKEGKYVVDPTGAGWISNRSGGPPVQEFGSAEEAVTAALVDAIKDGALKGISEAAKRLLLAGNDLDAALDKVFKFQSVFTELKKIKDPVGAAIDELNTQFQELIGIFTEAGASASEWSQLQELYDLKRADAIKSATNDTISALTDFIQSMTSGTDSPLSRRTVYNNAKAEVDKYRADIASGKAVDQDALVKALNDFEQASQTLFGSRGQFYSDFNDILALAQKAKDNATAGTTTTPGPLPPSPFDSSGPWNQLVAGQGTTNDILTQINNNLQALNGGGGTSTGSTIADLPYYGGVDQGSLYLQRA